MIKNLQEKDLVEQFLQDNVYFRGPDATLINHHGLEPITSREQEAIKETSNETISLIRNRVQAATTEACEMMIQTGAAPGAKWGDLITGFYTASGDLSVASSKGVVAFATTSQYAVKYVKKYWEKDSTVGINPGDAFMHNDARYGGVHNADHSMMLPLFHEGELIGWAGAVIHEGENGAVEPGGIPVLAESKFMEGLSISPMKIAENYTLRNDIVTFLQNSVREPKLMMQDLRTRLSSCMRLQKRLEEIIDEFGADAVIATLRKTLDDTDQEVRKRVSEWQDGKVRSMYVVDSTLRENVLIKANIEIEKKGDTLIINFEGTSPEFFNRSMNATLSIVYGTIATVFCFYVWPDLPKNQAVINSMKFIVPEKSIFNCSNDVPNALSMAVTFPMIMGMQSALAKFLYSADRRYTKIMAPMYDMISMFVYGGITQNGETVGNLGADLNGMPGGARSDMDGEHALTITAAIMADQGEQELLEEELPWLHLSRRLLKDNQGFGKFRGGTGYQQIVSVKDSPYWGLGSTTMGSKYPTVNGIFGGYGCPAYPLAKVKGVNVFEIMKENPELFNYDIADIMNNRPFEGASYSTHQKGMGFELIQEGELYMQAQGTGGGYGDVLDRDPQSVIRDLEDGLISNYVAENIYHVVYDSESFVMDLEATEEKRKQEREARKNRGLPFKEFVLKWTTEKPSEELPWYGSWGNDRVVYTGTPHQTMPVDQLQSIPLQDPKDVRIAELEEQISQIRAENK